MNDHPIVRPADVRALVTGLRIPEPFTTRTFVGMVSELIGRRIKVRSFPAQVVEAFRQSGESLPYGLMLDTGRGVAIFYRADTGPSHRQHVILHELGHVLCRHVTNPVEERDVRDADVIGTALRRSRYDDEQEQAAELVAYLVQQRVGPLRMPPSGATRSGNTAAAQFGSLLEG
jgi:hypothetical protein